MLELVCSAVMEIAGLAPAGALERILAPPFQASNALSVPAATKSKVILPDPESIVDCVAERIPKPCDPLEPVLPSITMLPPPEEIVDAVPELEAPRATARESVEYA